MQRWIRKNTQTIVVAMLTAALTAGGPVVAARMVRYARNAGKVDGKHAVAAKASKKKRRGKLVATNPKTGLLPNNIIKKAKNSNLLDGFDSTDFLGVAATAADSELLDGMDSSAFLGVAATAADSELLDGMDSSEFLAPTQNGMILWSSDASDWKAGVGAGDLALLPSTGQTLVQPQTASGNAQMFMTADVPVALYGKQLSVTGVEICYDAAAAHLLDDVRLEKATNSNGMVSVAAEVLDSTDRTDEACRLYGVTDQALPSETTFGLKVGSAWTATTDLKLGRVTWVLAPTATDATPLS